MKIDLTRYEIVFYLFLNKRLILKMKMKKLNLNNKNFKF